MEIYPNTPDDANEEYVILGNDVCIDVQLE
jgi:hypothetical protein